MNTRNITRHIGIIIGAALLIGCSGPVMAGGGWGGHHMGGGWSGGHMGPGYGMQPDRSDDMPMVRDDRDGRYRYRSNTDRGRDERIDELQQRREALEEELRQENPDVDKLKRMQRGISELKSEIDRDRLNRQLENR